MKFHFKTNQGIRNFTGPEASQMTGVDPDCATRDLFSAIQGGDFPSWTVYIQAMKPEDAVKYRWNIFDVTKVWPHKDYPLLPVGKMVLNRNPENYFAEVEQAAFSPSHMVPGIEPSADRMLQGRLFSYPDTHRHRLGVNYQQIPINRPVVPVNNHHRDGFMAVDGNQGSAPNYEPNSGNLLKVTPSAAMHEFEVHGLAARHTVRLTDDDFVQPGALYRLLSAEQKENLVSNIVGHLRNAKKTIQERQLQHFKRADAEWGRRIESGLQKARL